MSDDWRKKIRIYHICSNCKKEYLLQLGMGNWLDNSLSVCPDCNHQDDLFIKITMEQDKFSKDEHGFVHIYSKEDLKEYLELNKESFKDKYKFLPVVINDKRHVARMNGDKIILYKLM